MQMLLLNCVLIIELLLTLGLAEALEIQRFLVVNLNDAANYNGRYDGLGTYPYGNSYNKQAPARTTTTKKVIEPPSPTTTTLRPPKAFDGIVGKANVPEIGSTPAISDRFVISDIEELLGAGVQSTSYQPHRWLSHQYISQSSELDCDFSESCNWRNDPLNGLFWRRMNGKLNAANWKAITGTDQLPDEHLLLISAFDSTEHGLLVSKTVPCQVGDGKLDFNLWRSLSTSVPPELQIVFRAYNFVDQIRTGFVGIDDLNYETQSESIQCRGRPLAQPSPIKAESFNPINQDDLRTCEALTCDFSSDICLWNGFGRSAVAQGVSVGWQRRNIQQNRQTNSLTGIREPPNGREDSVFLVAEFPSAYRETVHANMRYVLESAQFRLTSPRVFSFQRYVTVLGVELLVCADVRLNWCLFGLSTGLEIDDIKREWVTEFVQLPPGEYKLLVIARYAGGQAPSINIGQIGLSSFVMLEKVESEKKICQ